VFHNELLSQSHWNPGDDFGRIKIVIAEGFSRDNSTFPFERVKNIVSFSFQHAPLGKKPVYAKIKSFTYLVLLDVLETSSIAWPNAAMWRQVSLLAPYFVQHTSPCRRQDDAETHSHSPRRGTGSMRPPPTVSSLSVINPENIPTFPSHAIFDPFIEAEQTPMKSWRQPRQSSTADVSMPDYSKSNTRTNSSRHVTDPMIVSDSEISDRRFESLQSAGAYESICEALEPSAPVNTPAEPTPEARRRVSPKSTGSRE
jgi:hypothetical protein